MSRMVMVGAHVRHDDNRVSSLAFSPDSRLLAAGFAGVTRVWEVATYHEVVELKKQVGKISSLAFSPDSKELATANQDDYSVYFWQIPSGQSAREPWKYDERVYAIKYSPDGKSLGAACWRAFLLKEVATNKVSLRVPGAGYFDFSLDGTALALDSYEENGKITILDVRTKSVVRTFASAHRVTKELAFSKDGKTLATIFGAAVRLWDVATTKELIPFDAHRGAVGPAAFSRDGSKVLVRASSRQYFLWSSPSGALLADFVLPLALPQYSLSPNGASAAIASRAGLTICDTSKGVIVKEWPLPVTICIYSPDGKSILTDDSRQNRLCLWDEATGNMVRQFRRELKPGEVWAPKDIVDAKYVKIPGFATLAFSGDGRIVALAGWAPDICVWRVADGKNTRNLHLPLDQDASERNRIVAVTSLSLSSDGRMMAAVERSHGVFVCSVEKGKILRQLHGDVASLSADGKLLATGEKDSVLLWELVTGEVICRLEGHKAPITSVVFSSDKKTLASTSMDQTAILWNLGDLPTLSTSRILTGPPGAKLADSWKDLDSKDAPTGYRAILHLIAAGPKTVDVLKDRLKPAPVPDVARIQRLIEQLNADDFNTRENAFTSIRQIAPQAEPQLRRASMADLDPETKQRVDILLNPKVNDGHPKGYLQHIRAIQVLERIGTAEAKVLLESLAAGGDWAEQTRDAGAALARLRK